MLWMVDEFNAFPRIVPGTILSSKVISPYLLVYCGKFWYYKAGGQQQERVTQQ